MSEEKVNQKDAKLVLNNGWNPVELLSPKIGELVLSYSPDEGVRQTKYTTYQKGSIGYDEGRSDCWFEWVSHNNRCCKHNATHWMKMLKLPDNLSPLNIHPHPAPVTLAGEKYNTMSEEKVSTNSQSAVLADVIGYDTSRQPIIPVRDKLVIKKNAHPNCDGTAWGWIEGCSLNICWSDENSRFNRQKAEELVGRYNAR